MLHARGADASILDSIPLPIGNHRKPFVTFPE
jgi:hypothetical protein